MNERSNRRALATWASLLWGPLYEAECTVYQLEASNSLLPRLCSKSAERRIVLEDPSSSYRELD